MVESEIFPGVCVQAGCIKLTKKGVTKKRLIMTIIILFISLSFLLHCFPQLVSSSQPVAASVLHLKRVVQQKHGILVRQGI